MGSTVQGKINSILVSLLCLAGLYLAELYSFLLFHVLIEIFSVVVAFAIFMFAWNTRTKISNGSLLLLGAAYLIIGGVDLLHTLSYKGMGVLTTFNANSATQLWIAARYIESLTLVAAPCFAHRTLSMGRTTAAYAALFVLLVVAIFILPVFPDCYIDGGGLTPFKKVSEYLIALILLAGLVGLRYQRAHFDERVFRMLNVSILLTVISEMMFTFYISVYGISNFIGHLFKLASFWLIYKAVIETGLQKPYALLFRDLAQSEKRYRDLVDTLPVGICEIEPDFLINYINPAGLKIIGYGAEDFRRGLSLNKILDPGDHKKVHHRMNALQQGRSLESTEYQIVRKDGVREDIIVNSSPVYRNGQLKTIQVSLTLVTELKRMQTFFEQARKMEAVAVLAGGMAHEINNVLMGLVGRIELIRLNAIGFGMPDSEFTDALRACERIAGLIRQLLAYSRGGRYQTRVTDLTELIGETLSEFEERNNPNIYLSCDVSPDLPKISADPTQLRMVMSEILANAAEAIDDTGRIEILLYPRTFNGDRSRRLIDMPSGRYACLEVTDTGKGMDADTLQHIFEPFFTKKFPGRGLGMAAAFGIVKNHGGWIGVDSIPGRGTTVRVYFPMENR